MSEKLIYSDSERNLHNDYFYEIYYINENGGTFKTSFGDVDYSDNLPKAIRLVAGESFDFDGGRSIDTVLTTANYYEHENIGGYWVYTADNVLFDPFDPMSEPNKNVNAVLIAKKPLSSGDFMLAFMFFDFGTLFDDRAASYTIDSLMVYGLYDDPDPTKNLSRNYTDKEALPVKNPIADALDRLTLAMDGSSGGSPSLETRQVRLVVDDDVDSATFMCVTADKELGVIMPNYTEPPSGGSETVRILLDSVCIVKGGVFANGSGFMMVDSAVTEIYIVAASVNK